jgi:hypothetical protein
MARWWLVAAACALPACETRKAPDQAAPSSTWRASPHAERPTRATATIGPPVPLPTAETAGTVPATAVAAAVVDGVFLGDFEVQRDARDADLGYLAAQRACMTRRTMLCTELQWQRGCAVTAELGRFASWTASWDESKVVVRGGSGCEARATAVAASHDADRGAACCSRAIAIHADGDAVAVDSAYADQLHFEQAQNSKLPHMIESLYAATVVIDGKESTAGEATRAQESAWRNHPDQWSLYESCDVRLADVRCGKSECPGVVHDCILLQALDSEISVLKQRIARRHDDTTQRNLVVAIDERERSRKHGKP